MSRVSKMEKYEAGADALRDAVNEYRAQKPSAEPPPPKPEWRPRPPLDRPSEIPGFPLNANPPAHIPEYGTMARVQAIRNRQRKPGARLPAKPFGEPQLRKRAK